MTKQNAKVIYWEEYVNRLRKNDDLAHGGGDGLGMTPGQRLKRQTAHISSILQWFLENLTQSEWENAAKKHSGIPYPSGFILSTNSSRVKESASPEQEEMLKRIILAFHDPIMAEHRIKEALNDPLWELHNYRQLFKIENMPFPPENDTA